MSSERSGPALGHNPSFPPADTCKNQDFDPQTIKDHIKKLSHKFPTGHQPCHLISGEVDKTKTLYKTYLKPKDLLYFKNCKNCYYTVSAVCTKVMIENSDNVTLVITDTVLTNIVEIWKCNNINLEATKLILFKKIGTAIYTIQIDICDMVKLKFNDITNYHQVVWAGAENLSIEFERASQHNIETGLTKMKELHNDLNDEIDQFIIRFLDGKLVSEQIIRLKNGYPTTAREADAWDAQHQRNETFTEEQLRNALKMTPQIGIHNINLTKRDGSVCTIKTSKIGRNEPCPCKSGLKYKKCCQEQNRSEDISKSVVTQES